MKENKRVSYKTGVKKYFLSNTKDKKGTKKSTHWNGSKFKLFVSKSIIWTLKKVSHMQGESIFKAYNLQRIMI